MVIVNYISGSNIFEFRSKILDCFFFFLRSGNQSKIRKYLCQIFHTKILRENIALNVSLIL